MLAYCFEVPKYNTAGRKYSFQETGIVKPGLPVWLPTKQTTPTQLTQADPALALPHPPRKQCVPLCTPPRPMGEGEGWMKRGEDRAGQKTLSFPPEFSHVSTWSVE